MGPVVRPRVNCLQLEIRHIEISHNTLFATIPRVQNYAVNTRCFVGRNGNDIPAFRVGFRKLFGRHSLFPSFGRAMGPYCAALNKPFPESAFVIGNVEIPAGLGGQVIERIHPRTRNGVSQCTYGAIATVPFETALFCPTRVRVLNPEMRAGLVILLESFSIHKTLFLSSRESARSVLGGFPYQIFHFGRYHLNPLLLISETLVPHPGFEPGPRYGTAF